MIKKIINTGLLAALLLPTVAISAELSDVKRNIQATGVFEESSNITVFGELPLKSMKGFYEVSVDGEIFIFSEDGKTMLTGDLYAFGQGGIRAKNISADLRQQRQRSQSVAIPSLSEKYQIVHKPTNDKTYGTLYVFTDPTCGYCQLLHGELDQYSELGIQVNYLPYPRGPHVDENPGYVQLRNIMCSDDPQQAMHAYKTRGDVSAYENVAVTDTCLESLAQVKKLADKIGIRGTPFLYTSTGEVIAGYSPAQNVFEKIVK